VGGCLGVGGGGGSVWAVGGVWLPSPNRASSPILIDEFPRSGGGSVLFARGKKRPLSSFPFFCPK